MLSEIKNESTMKKKTYLVLILVLMEDALGGIRLGQVGGRGLCVLILVLMEDALGEWRCST